MDTTGLVLLLSDIPGVGEKTLAVVLRRNAVLRRSSEEFLRCSVGELVQEYGMRREAANTLAALSAAQCEEGMAIARQLRRAGVSVLTLLDASYPTRLLDALDDPPPVLYAYGNPALFSSPLFAVANSNGASEEALAATDAAASVAVSCGWSPVTGHNRPGYQRPALVARRSGGRICYVLDRGLIEAFGGDLTRELFPAARIWSPIYDPAHDLTLSPFGLRDHGIAAHNRRRDDLVFALAKTVFVGEIRLGGQMERVCRHALARGAAVFLLAPRAGEREEFSVLRDAGARLLVSHDVSGIVEALQKVEAAG